ncbi:MAG: hypothetical protein J2P50_20755 [Hyphomicrobiaceae bacterium]|nr:hypothetical protein [Hyphomicrobiaceae bacterium]
MSRAFYDLRPDKPYGTREIAALQHEGQIDRERQYVERAQRSGNERRLRLALSSLHTREERPER